MTVIRVDVSAFQSSNLKSLGYELSGEKIGVLEVEFAPGKGKTVGVVYRYFDVPVTVYGELIDARSIGKEFHRLIKQGGFRYEKVSDAS